MKKRHILLIILIIAAICVICTGCGQNGSNEIAPNGANNSASEPTSNDAPNNEAPNGNEAPLPDGTYTAKFDTDSSMFHVNEAYKGKGTLTVKDGQMTIHIVMPSKNIVNLFYGLAADAQKDGAEVIEPTVEKVKYSDGMEEEVYAFDVPVPYLDKEFDCALVGTKGKWYDHKVSVSGPEAVK